MKRNKKLPAREQRIRQVYKVRENSVAEVTLFCFLMRE